jgi:hypothetical protein
MPRVNFCPVEEAGILAQRSVMSTVKKNGRGKSSPEKLRP